MPTSIFQHIRTTLRSFAPLRTAVRLLEDLMVPRHPERNHPVIPLDDAFPDAERVQVKRPDAVHISGVSDLPLASEASHLQEQPYIPPPSFGARLPNVLFCPYNNVILTDDRRVIAESVGPPHCIETLNRRPLSENRIEAIPGTSTALRAHYRNHYEMLVENLPRLALLHESPFSTLEQVKVLYSPPLTAMEAYLVRRLLPDNATLYPVHPNRCLYRPESYVLSGFLTQCYGSYLPEWYQTGVRNRLLPKRAPRSNGRLFISRAQSDRRRIQNREELLTALAPFGFQSVILENHSPAQQVNLFFDAEMVVAAHGAGLANLCFAANTHVLELFPTREVRPCYLFLCASLGVPYDYCIPSPERTAKHVFDDFEVDVSAVVRHVSKRIRPVRTRSRSAPASRPDPVTELDDSGAAGSRLRP